ncbi:hypothetical protein [Pseudofulvibacter geojedonensis]|uniref:Riboflavin synthase subunit beta n=1 Tax=Pseudofulvibacter geojedonensis TaxID=1123758 RepID=A0ABW3I2J5_9FLAO
MRLPTLFKQNKNKSFGYTPRYYDERKERLQKLHEKHHGTTTESNIKGSFRRSSFRDDWRAVNKEKDQKQSQSRLLVIIALLVVITILVLDKYNIKLF